MRTLNSDSPESWMRAILRLIIRLALYSWLIAGTIYVLLRLKAVLVSLFIAAILAYIMRPLAGWMARRGILVPRSRPMHVRRVITPLHVLVFMFLTSVYSINQMVTSYVIKV